MSCRLCLSVIACAWAIASLCAVSPDAYAADAERPNVIFILADDLGYSDLGCYGAVHIQTPNLDRLADDGLRYTQFYNTGRCWPTRTAWLTGYYAQQVLADSLKGINRKQDRPVTRTLLPKRLEQAGYVSYHSGKWHIWPGPRATFEESGFADSYRMNDHDRFFYPQHHLLNGKPLPPVAKGTDYYVTDAITDHAVKQLAGHAAKHGKAPFFQYVAYTTPHFPLHAVAEDIAKYRDAYLSGWEQLRAARAAKLKKLGFDVPPMMGLEPDVYAPWSLSPAQLKAQIDEGEMGRAVAWDSLTDVERRFQATKMAIHAAMVDRLDQGVGRIVAQLKQSGDFENTVILFASDNGASAEMLNRGDKHTRGAALGGPESYLCLGPGFSTAANTPFRLHKSWNHEGGISTPLIVHWPAGIAAEQNGSLRHTPGHVIDLAPTIMSLAGLNWPAEENGGPLPPPPGRNLTPTFADDVPIRRDFLWWHHEGNRAIRAGDYKAVSRGDHGWELYNLAVDRGETNNLADDQPERLQNLTGMWEAFAETIRRQVKP
jgi:arylsulfatase A-like enzyme